uniref:CCHC-type domain-containing protein n=1 Tax=Amphimedon queenslandica TaxID=400682 RepID=A0A1X7URT2_AMPQE
MIREQGKCFVCLRPGHISKHCRSSMSCATCRGRHHSSVCMRNSKPISGQRPPTARDGASTHLSKGLNPETPPFEGSNTGATFYTSSRESTLLQVARVFAFNLNEPGNRMSLYVLLDSGSQCSYITRSACQRLGLPSLGTKSVSIMTFGSRKECRIECHVVKLGLELKNNAHMELKLLTVSHICEPLTYEAIDLNKYPHLNNLDISIALNHCKQIKPDILIGSDQYWSLLTGEIMKSNNGQVALNSCFGWILSGTAAVKQSSARSATMVTHVLRVDGVHEDMSLEHRLRSFWELEYLGILEDENLVQTQFGDHVKFANGKYVVSLPWKDSCISLADNYQLCLRRLSGLFKRLKSSPELLKKYDDIITEQLALGIIVPVENSEECSVARIHYLPHHCVLRQDKSTTRLRIVYDASAKTNGPSLNNCLHIGPSLHQKVFDILLRFRMWPIAIVADIEKAFFMIQVADVDQDVLRFLWYKDVFCENPELQIYKFTCVVFGVAPSPYLLNATIAQHLSTFESRYPDLIQKIKDSIYVDDVITGVDNVSEAFSLYKDSKDIFAKGGFNLRKFLSNNAEVQSLIDSAEQGIVFEGDEHETYAQSTLGRVNSALGSEQKVLGVLWDPIADDIIIDLTLIFHEAKRLEPTKRKLVSVISLCNHKIGWDDSLPEPLLLKWKQLLTGLEAQPLRLARYCTTSDLSSKPRLIGFCDASLKAYAAVVYLENCDKELALLASKTRVSPLKSQTVPRQELLGAVLLARLIFSFSGADYNDIAPSSVTPTTEDTVANECDNLSGKAQLSSGRPRRRAAAEARDKYSTIQWGEPGIGELTSES